jgi:hypothetical protein
MHSMGMMFRMWQLLSSQSVIVVLHDTKCDLSFPSLELEWVRKTLMENSCHATCSWMSCQIEGCKLNVISYWSLRHVLLETQICKVRNLGKWNIGIKTSNARITSKCEHERERVCVSVFALKSCNLCEIFGVYLLCDGLDLAHAFLTWIIIWVLWLLRLSIRQFFCLDG